MLVLEQSPLALASYVLLDGHQQPVLDELYRNYLIPSLASVQRKEAERALKILVGGKCTSEQVENAPGVSKRLLVRNLGFCEEKKLVVFNLSKDRSHTLLFIEQGQYRE